MGDERPIKLTIRGPAIPRRFVNDDAAIVFQVQPLGVGTAGAAAPERNATCGIDHKVAVCLKNGIRPRMPLRSRSPCAGTVRPVIDEKVSVGIHEQKVLAMRRDYALPRRQSLACNKVRPDAATGRRERAGAGGGVNASLPLEYVQH